jgi:hypothetical protein
MQTNNNNQALVNAIAELTAQVEKLTQENASLREEVKPGHDVSAEIDAVIKALPRERVMEVLNLRDFKLMDVDSAVLLKYVVDNYDADDVLGSLYDKDVTASWVRENFGVEEVYANYTIRDYVKYNCQIDDVYEEDDIYEWVKDNRSIDDVYDSEDIVEWVRDNRNVSDVYDHSDILECVEDFEVSDVLTHFGEEIVMEECSNQGWSKSKDVSDVISQLEDVISQLKA